MRFSLFTLGLILFNLGNPIMRAADSHLAPIPLPKTIRIESASLREKVWNTLTPKQKKLTHYLLKASREGRPLLFLQSHRHALALKEIIEKSLSIKNIEKTKSLLGAESFQEYLVYAAKFLDLAGPYASSNRKYILQKSTPEMVGKLLDTYGKVKEPAREEMVKLLTDPAFELMRGPETSTGEGLEGTGGNLYEKGITGKEVLSVLDKSLNTTLNCRVTKTAKGLACEPQTTSSKGMVGATLKKVVDSLKKAREFSETKYQKEQLDYMISYFKTGNIEDFRQANIAWVRDGAKSPVDFMIGWVEVYEDWLARIASWESYVQVVDPEISKLAAKLASHAQYFEDGMPYGTYKKKFPENYAPPAIMVYYFQEIASYRSGGYNLPNFDDIRRDVGAKNVIRLPMPGENLDPELKSLWVEVLNEYLPSSKVQSVLENREKLYRVIVLLHEIIGHGSGTYDTTKYKQGEDPISGLGPLGSALEEQRADLTALVFGGDSKLIDVGIYKNAEEAKKCLNLMYDFYIADFLRRLSGQRSMTEAHQRGHWLFIHQLLEEGAIQWEARDGKSKMTLENQVLVVKDYDKFHKVAVNSLEELQRIKANREEKALQQLFDTHAPLQAASEPWAQAVIKRGENLKINAGYIEQPWKVDARGKYHSFGSTTLEGILPYYSEMN